MVPKVFPGCQTPVKDGTVIVTGEYDKRDPSVPTLPYDASYKPGDRAKKSQADTLEGLLLNHPLDCPVCDKAGECKLQDFSYQFGRSESRMVDPKNTPPNKPGISSTITLFTDRCIMCTRCVRFTREVSGTAELTVTSRGHHAEIDVFPGRPLENKLAGNVVDLCPVGALGSKDFLYTQRVWYLKESDSVCPLCSTGCSVHVDANKDIVYRLRPRVNPDAQGYFMCDEGRYGYHFVNSAERIVRPTVAGQRATWHDFLPKLKADLAAAAGLVGVLSPFLTVEEAYLYAAALKAISPDAKLVLGPVPVVGADDRYPKDVKGNPVEPTKFVIRAEKCPNRRGVEAVLRHFEGKVTKFSEVGTTGAMVFVGGYPDATALESAPAPNWAAPALLVVQDLFPSALSANAKYVLPATAAYEKDGTYVNHAGLAQSFGRAVRPPTEVRGELQIAFDLLGRKGLAQATTIRKELAGIIAEFAGLGEVPRTGKKIELQTV
jgi:NADH-quinone oxidoreductase subunit G